MKYYKVVLKRSVIQRKTMIVAVDDSVTDKAINRAALEQDNGNGYSADRERWSRRVESVTPVEIQ